MKSILKIIKSTFLGGDFIFSILILLLVLLEKGYRIKIAKPIINHFTKVEVLGLAMEEIVALFIIVFVCFTAALISKRDPAQKLIDKLENGTLNEIIGLNLMRP